MSLPTFDSTRVLDPVFRVDPQSLGYPVDVVEIGDHLDTTGDTPVVETDSPEILDVFGSDSGRRASELFGKPDHRKGLVVESRRVPIDGHPVDQFVICDLGTEIVEVRRRSVVTIVYL